VHTAQAGNDTLLQLYQRDAAAARCLQQADAFVLFKIVCGGIHHNCAAATGLVTATAGFQFSIGDSVDTIRHRSTSPFTG